MLSAVIIPFSNDQVTRIENTRISPFVPSLKSKTNVVAAAGVAMFNLIDKTNDLQDKLHSNTDYFVAEMKKAGFDIKPTQSAICAVMLYDAKLSQDFAAALQKEGIYVTGFYYPVVPKGQARIRVQVSAAHEKEHLDRCIAAFTKIGKELGVIK